MRPFQLSILPRLWRSPEARAAIPHFHHRGKASHAHNLLSDQRLVEDSFKATWIRHFQHCESVLNVLAHRRDHACCGRRHATRPRGKPYNSHPTEAHQKLLLVRGRALTIATEYPFAVFPMARQDQKLAQATKMNMPWFRAVVTQGLQSVLLLRRHLWTDHGPPDEADVLYEQPYKELSRRLRTKGVINPRG
jgi:hypothetical protein